MSNQMKRKINISLVISSLVMNILSVLLLFYVKEPGKAMAFLMIAIEALSVILVMTGIVWNRKGGWIKYLSVFSISLCYGIATALLLRWGCDFAPLTDIVSERILPVRIFGQKTLGRETIILIGGIGTFLGLLNLVVQMIPWKNKKGTGVFGTLGLVLALLILFILYDRQNTLVPWKGIFLLAGLSLGFSVYGLRECHSLRILSALAIPLLVAWPIRYFFQIQLPLGTYLKVGDASDIIFSICAIGLLIGGVYAVIKKKSYLKCSLKCIMATTVIMGAVMLVLARYAERTQSNMYRGRY